MSTCPSRRWRDAVPSVASPSRSRFVVSSFLHRTISCPLRETRENDRKKFLNHSMHFRQQEWREKLQTNKSAISDPPIFPGLRSSLLCRLLGATGSSLHRSGRRSSSVHGEKCLFRYFTNIVYSYFTIVQLFRTLMMMQYVICMHEKIKMSAIEKLSSTDFQDPQCSGVLSKTSARRIFSEESYAFFISTIQALIWSYYDFFAKFIKLL